MLARPIHPSCSFAWRAVSLSYDVLNDGSTRRRFAGSSAYRPRPCCSQVFSRG